MKILHTSDWHLGAKLGEYSRLEEQRMVLEEIRTIAVAEDVELIILSGDIFDNFNPSNEAVELLYRELKRLAADSTRPVIAIAGNHDSPDRIEAPDPLAAECGIFFIGYPDFTRAEVTLDGGAAVRCADVCGADVCGAVVRFPEKGIITVDFPQKPQVRIITTPYANENRLKKYLEAENREQKLSELLGAGWKSLADRYCDKDGINILTAHLFMADLTKKTELQPDLFDSPGLEAKASAQASSQDLPQEPDGERSILHPGGLEMIDTALIPPQIQYTALGHLHRPQTVRDGASPAVYPGSPLALGLSEENQQKSVVIVDIEPGGAAELERIPLKSGRRILRKTFEGADAAVAWLSENPDCYVELIIECDKYISAEDRRRLFAAHDGITAVIPMSRQDSGEGGERGGAAGMPDLSSSMEDLFKSFFEYSKGVPPDEAIVELFREAAAIESGDGTPVEAEHEMQPEVEHEMQPEAALNAQAQAHPPEGGSDEA